MPTVLSKMSRYHGYRFPFLLDDGTKPTRELSDPSNQFRVIKYEMVRMNIYFIFLFQYLRCFDTVFLVP